MKLKMLLQSAAMAGLVFGTAASAVAAEAEIGAWGFDLAGMNRDVAPGTDFFEFANGRWDVATDIPGDRATWGVSSVLRERSAERVRSLIEGYAAQRQAAGSDRAKIAALYLSFNDHARVEGLGARPIANLLEDIREADDKRDIARTMGRAFGDFGGTFFDGVVFDDVRAPERYALYLGHDGLGLADREFYIDERFAEQKAKYQEHVANMLTLLEWQAPAAAAAAIVALETDIATAHWPIADSRDWNKIYNPMTPDELAEFAPGFEWAAFYDAAGIDDADRFVVMQNTSFPKIARVFAGAELDTLKAWQAFHTVSDAAPYLSSAFVDEDFAFYQAFLNGQPEQRPRWKRAVAVVELGLGEAVGRDYVAAYFPPESKRAMEDLVANLLVAMRARIEGLEWMGPETRKEALAKLSTVEVRVGYPAKWRDYSSLRVSATDLVGNMRHIAAFEWRRDARRIGQRVDKSEWNMSPQTVNASYSPARNVITFPAGILQPPFFDVNADPAVNYGAIGGVIGHEISHGFDDQGRKTDGHGMLRDWWTTADAEAFEARAARLGEQYETYTFDVLPGLHLNGKLTMGENIGDLGGLLVALDAYRASLDGAEPPVLDGFTGEQRFFLGWAQNWRSKYREGALRQQIVSDPHSPGPVRAYAPLRNIDAWYSAFGVDADDPLFVAPADRVRIW